MTNNNANSNNRRYTLAEVNAAISRVEQLTRTFASLLGREQELKLQTAAGFMHKAVSEPPFDGAAIMAECKTHLVAITVARFENAANDLKGLKARIAGSMPAELDAELAVWLKGHKQGQGSVTEYFGQAEKLAEKMDELIRQAEEAKRFQYGKCKCGNPLRLAPNGKPYPLCGGCYHDAKASSGVNRTSLSDEVRRTGKTAAKKAKLAAANEALRKQEAERKAREEALKAERALAQATNPTPAPAAPKKGGAKGAKKDKARREGDGAEHRAQKAEKATRGKGR